ncbi:MAG TPA: hypothetical protein VK816_03515, partial [Jatrophihabitantaceae bacterium]|nr:hypothetical protein [Jatrophihabitantaceae bacterium]
STPNNADNSSHRWNVSVAQSSTATGGCTPAVGAVSSPTNTTIAAPSSDPLFQNTSGTQSVTTQTTTTCLTATVSLQVGTCSVLNLLICVGQAWGDGSGLLGGGKSIPQFTVTEAVATTQTATSRTSTSSQFPVSGDVSTYGMGPAGTGSTGNAPGDLYVEGSATSSLGLVAGNDMIVTGNLTSTGANAGTEIVAGDNVRIYHPVSCVDSAPADIAATTAGFCPNDITGLYSGVLPTSSRPDQQYANLPANQATQAVLSNPTVDAAIFALGTESSTTLPCPTTSGGGTCDGSLVVDNPNRGNGLGSLDVIGSVIQVHHGAVGEEWQINDTAGQSSRPYSGYHLSIQYQNLQSAITGVNVIPLTTASGALWHVLSVSTGN